MPCARRPRRRVRLICFPAIASKRHKADSFVDSHLNQLFRIVENLHLLRDHALIILARAGVDRVVDVVTRRIIEEAQSVSGGHHDPQVFVLERLL